MYHSFLIHSSADGHLGCFHVLEMPYDYTMEVTNKFKGLDMRDRVFEKLCTEVHDFVQEAVIKMIPKGKKMQKGKMVL